LKDPLPRAKVETAFGHRDYHLAAHHAHLQARCDPLQVRVGGPVRPGQASSPVRLCNRPLGRRRR
jgi:hypothetical protein